MSQTPRPFRFTRSARLQHKREFDAVYAARARIERGPMVVQAIPTIATESRLGLSIGRRLGNAVRRNRLKRLLREAFRLDRGTFPRAYDVVISLRPHDEQPLETYRALLRESIEAVDRLWMKRHQRKTPDPASPPDC
jgi:ribonuclease P protein component